MKTVNLMAKAVQAGASAALLLKAGDLDGACNRAYYSMFDAARAALLASGAPVEPEIARTHGGLIAAFSLHLVKPGRVPMELGRSLNKVAELRLVGDYKGDPLAEDEAIWAVNQARIFVQAMQDMFQPGTPVR